MELIKDIIFEIDARPGLPKWEFAVRCYAVDMLEDFISCIGLTIWDETEKIEKITEKDLLNGAVDWIHYSLTGNALIWTDDISMRLFGMRTCAASPEILMILQGMALKQAAQLILHTLRFRGDFRGALRGSNKTAAM